MGTYAGLRLAQAEERERFAVATEPMDGRASFERWLLDAVLCPLLALDYRRVGFVPFQQVCSLARGCPDP